MGNYDKDSLIIYCPKCKEILLWRDSKFIMYDARKEVSYGMFKEEREKGKEVNLKKE